MNVRDLFPIAALAFGLVLSPAAGAAGSFEFWPDAQYDPAVPTIESVVGHRPGERITPSGAVVRYFDRLQQAIPDRVRVTRYGKTWQGRQLVYVTITSPANMARLDAIQAGLRELADPRRTGAARAEELIATLPASMWLTAGVHGNELSSTDAAMLLAYHLLAATNDPRTPRILADTVVYIDPNQNPDGRQRFLQQNDNAAGPEPDPSRLAAERVEPWPGGRGNHYLFDMNRDWIAATQPETRGRIAVLRDLMPLVFVDLHEMGGDSTYYFAPDAVPYNPHLVEGQRRSLDLFGRNNAAWFERFGIDYFSGEVFDAFFPGYGSSWPAYYGAVAMTYEQARVRGLVFRRYDDTLLYYGESVRDHFVGLLSTAEVTAVNRERFLRDFYRYRVSAVEEGRRQKLRAWVIPTQLDQSAADKLAGLLAFHGAEVSRATSALSACGKDYPAGSYVIPKAQPLERLLRVMLDEQIAMPADFTAEQERRRAKRLETEIYDVTAWSLPLVYNLRVDECATVGGGDLMAVPAGWERPGTLRNPEASVAFLVPWGSAGSARLAVRALRAGLAVKNTDKAFSLGGREYPAGTLIFDVADNAANLPARLSELAAATGAEVVGVSDGWVTSGPNFGSEHVRVLALPRVIVAWDDPTSSTSAGAGRFVLEQQFGMAVTVARTASLAGADLRDFDVLVLPEQDDEDGYRRVLGEGGVDNLRRWVEEGGTIIALGEAVRFMADPKSKLSSLRVEDAYVEPSKDAGEAKEATGKDGGGKEDAEEESTVAGSLIDSEQEYLAAIRPKQESPDWVPGTLVRGLVDADHWLGAGIAPAVNVVVSGSLIVAPLPLDKGVNVVRFAPADKLVSGGYLWEQNRRQLAYKPFATVETMGRGLLIGFTQDPNFRGQVDGLSLLFMNAVLNAPARVRRPD
jgi:hypothetical protein